jgi:hypothetical protein
MKFDPEKILQNIELRLRGRTAVVAVGLGVMVVSLWLVLKDYSLHPMFSVITGGGLLIGIVVFLALGLFGKARPEEISDKSFVHVDKLGIYLAHGIGSHKEMVHLMREVSGMKRLPLPTYEVRGNATNPQDYVALTEEQSKAVAEGIEQGIEKLLSACVDRLTPLKETPELPDNSEQEAPELAAKGKSLKPIK